MTIEKVQEVEQICAQINFGYDLAQIFTAEFVTQLTIPDMQQIRTAAEKAHQDVLKDLDVFLRTSAKGDVYKTARIGELWETLEEFD